MRSAMQGNSLCSWVVYLIFATSNSIFLLRLRRVKLQSPFSIRKKKPQKYLHI